MFCFWSVCLITSWLNCRNGHNKSIFDQSIRSRAAKEHLCSCKAWWSPRQSAWRRWCSCRWRPCPPSASASPWSSPSTGRSPRPYYRRIPLLASGTWTWTSPENTHWVSFLWRGIFPHHFSKRLDQVDAKAFVSLEEWQTVSRLNVQFRRRLLLHYIGVVGRGDHPHRLVGELLHHHVVHFKLWQGEVETNVCVPVCSLSHPTTHLGEILGHPQNQAISKVH